MVQVSHKKQENDQNKRTYVSKLISIIIDIQRKDKETGTYWDAIKINQ